MGCRECCITDILIHVPQNSALRAIRAIVALSSLAHVSDSPNCAKTFGRTFSCQAAAAAARSPASRAQRSTSMALVTSRHHLKSTRGARLCAAQAGDARGGRRWTGERGLAGAAPALAAPCGLACVGLRSADLARDAALLASAHPHYRRRRPCNVIIALKKRLHILMNADTKPAIKPDRVPPAAMRLCL